MITLRRFVQSDWDGFAGCEKFADNSNPLICTGDIQVADLPFATDEDQGNLGIFIVDGGYGESDGIVATLNFTRADGCPARYERKVETGATVRGAKEWFELSMSPRLTHDYLITAGFELLDGEE